MVMVDSQKLAPYGDHLIVSVNGTVLGDRDRELLSTVNPRGVIVFSENVSDENQFRQLVAEIRSAVTPQPEIAVDFEGGMVNRFRKITGDIGAMSVQPDMRAFGVESGTLLAGLGVTVNFAPVVDVDYGNKGNGLDGRYLGDDAETIVSRAGAYLEGLESKGVVGCLKHYPGLGRTVPDSHFQLPVLDGIDDSDEQPFQALSRTNRWVMVAHVQVTGFESISTYSQQLIQRLKRFHFGPIVSDDLSMKALPEEPLHDKVDRVLSAGMDYALVRIRGGMS